MGYDRYSRNPGFGREQDRDYPGPRDHDHGRDYGSGRDYSYSSARDYAAAGRDRDDHDSQRFDRQSRGSRDYYGGSRDRQPRADRDQVDFGRSSSAPYAGSYASDGRRFADYDRDTGRDRQYDRESPRGRRDSRDEDRGFFDRAGDEIRSWFGDEDAERRREHDQREDERRARESDTQYRDWRSQRVAEFDRDYDEYRRENSTRFGNEFGTWRTDRQGQRDSLSRVDEHMEVVGSDGEHVGTVDKVRGDRVILTKSDEDAGGHHHSIPSRWIDRVDDKVTIRKTAAEAKREWRDEERSGQAMFGDAKRDAKNEPDAGGHNLNRSFSGTY